MRFSGFRALGGFICAWLSFQNPLHAQLANTIWEGNANVSSFSLQPCVDGIPKTDLTIQGLKVQVPFEIWFLDNENLLVVGRRDKIGGDPANQKYFLLWGKFPSKESVTDVRRGTYARSRSAGSYAFQCERLRIGASSATTYQGSRISMTGSFLFKNGVISITKAVLTQTPNPGGPNKPKLLGAPKFAFGKLVKSRRIPSEELLSWEE
jgi:hypothetical protein